MTPEEFFSILHDVPPTKPISYRLYHDEQGIPLFYSMEDLPGTYIEVDAATYAAASHDVRVVGGQIQIVPKKMSIKKLKPSPTGKSCHPDDICVVVAETAPHVKWSLHESC